MGAIQLPGRGEVIHVIVDGKGLLYDQLLCSDMIHTLKKN